MRNIHHIVYWILVILLLTLVFGYANSAFSEAFYFVAMLMPVIVGTSYFFNYILVPKYLLKRRYFRFILYAIYTIIISVYFEMLVILLSFMLLANYQYANMNPIATNVFLLTFVLYGVVFLNGFISLIKKSFLNQHQIMTLESEKIKKEMGYLLIRVDRKTNKIMYDQIAYIESLADYVKIIKLDGEMVITKEKISAILEKLPSEFYRIHRSYIVNSEVITSFSKENIIINGKDIPISRTYKKEIIKKLGL